MLRCRLVDFENRQRLQIKHPHRMRIALEQQPVFFFTAVQILFGRPPPAERAAIESLKAGATDYILKQKRERLPAAVRRAVTEAAERARRQAAEEDLHRSEKESRLLFQGNPHPMWVFDLETLAILEVNEAATQHYGYTRDEFLRMTQADL